MRVVFMGAPAFAVSVLRRLVELSGTGIPDLPDKLAGLLASSKALKKENEALRRELCGYQAEGLLASGDRLVSCAAKDAGELRAMAEEDGQAELCCHFCPNQFVFSREELFAMIAKKTVDTAAD